MAQSSIGINWTVFGYFIKRYREHNGLSQRRMADQIAGISTAQVCRAEKGIALETAPYLVLCRALDLNPFEIIDNANLSIEELNRKVKEVA